MDSQQSLGGRTGWFLLIIIITMTIYATVHQQPFDAGQASQEMIAPNQVLSRSQENYLTHNTKNVYNQAKHDNFTNNILVSKSNRSLPKELKPLEPHTTYMNSLQFHNTSAKVKDYKGAIPHRIHQMWVTSNIPFQFESWVKSWMHHHPDWEYWLWTDEDILTFMQKYYPDYVEMYNSLPMALHRSDASRFFILYHYGGVYADLDMESLKPLDNLIDSHQCIFPQETYPHMYLLYKIKSPILLNCWMACRPGHPFFYTLYTSLMLNFGNYSDGAIYETGPMYVTKHYQQFTGESPKIWESTTTHNITVLTPDLIDPTADLNQDFFGICSLEDILPEAKKICDNLGNFTTPTKDSYTDHHWYHVVMTEKKIWNITPSVKISKLIPAQNLKLLPYL